VEWGLFLILKTDYNSGNLNLIDCMQKFSPIVVRIAIVLLFLWFGFQQATEPGVWIAYLPAWISYLPVTGETFVRLNGSFELIGALLLALGLFTRFLALILGIHLAGIAWTVGGGVGVRDAALSACTFSLAMSAPDSWTLDACLRKKRGK